MAEDTQSVKCGTSEETTREGEEKASPAKLSLTTDKRIDLAIAVGVALVGLFILVGARNIGRGMIDDPLTSRGLPNITGTFLLIVGIILAVLRLRIWSALPGLLVPAEGKDDEQGHPASWIRAFSIIFASMLWVFLLGPLGFLIVTPLFLLAVLLLMGMRSMVKSIAFSTVGTLMLWYVFSQPLNIILPLGLLAPFFRSLGLTP